MEIDGAVYPIIEQKNDLVIVRVHGGIAELAWVKDHWKIIGSTKSHLIRIILPEPLLETIDLIALEMPRDEFLSYCALNDRAHRVCQMPYIWEQKYLRDYGPPKHLPSLHDWRELYLHHGETWLFKPGQIQKLNVPMSKVTASWGIDLNGLLWRITSDGLEDAMFPTLVNDVQSDSDGATLVDRDGQVWMSISQNAWNKLPYRGKKAYPLTLGSILLIDFSDNLLWVNVLTRGVNNIGIKAAKVSIGSRLIGVLDLNGDVWVRSDVPTFHKVQFPSSKDIFVCCGELYSISLDNRLFKLKGNVVTDTNKVCVEYAKLSESGDNLYITSDLRPVVNEKFLVQIGHVQSVGGDGATGWFIR